MSTNITSNNVYANNHHFALVCICAPEVYWDPFSLVKGILSWHLFPPENALFRFVVLKRAVTIHAELHRRARWYCSAAGCNPWYLVHSLRLPRWKVEPGVDLLWRGDLVPEVRRRPKAQGRYSQVPLSLPPCAVPPSPPSPPTRKQLASSTRCCTFFHHFISSVLLVCFLVIAKSCVLLSRCC